MQKIQYIKDLIYYNRKYVIAIMIAILIILFYLNNTNSNQEILKEEIKEEINIVETEVEETKKVVVDIKGAVINPGIYEVDNNTRIDEIIKDAGGLTNDADTTNINLSKKVFDEMLIYIPKENEDKKIEVDENNIPTPSDNKISINNASIEQLMTIKGIGITKAQAIIDYRKSNGAFKFIEELTNVKGIGQTTFEKIKEFIKL